MSWSAVERNGHIMRKCLFIVPYFGKMPNYFPVFLKSCEMNPDYNWLFFTDDKTLYNYPQNVKVVFETSDDFINRIHTKLNIQTNIRQMHKLCDFKPAYGFICEEFLEDYLFWGFCDIDLIFGNLNHFITDEMLVEYDKLFCLGHFQMYKNTKSNNRVFMNEIEGDYWYYDSFTSEETTVFDEVGGDIEKNVNIIFKKYNFKILEEDYSMNTKIAPANFVRTKYCYESNGYRQERFKPALYVIGKWEDWKLQRFYIHQGNLICEEFLYMHFQQRSMRVSCKLDKKQIKILGDGFYDLTYSEINIKNFLKEKKIIISCRYLKTIGKWKLNGLYKKILFKVDPRKRIIRR